jgi:hypothetical protein
MPDNGFTFVGGTHSYDEGNGDIWLVRTDDLGNPVWNFTFGDEYGNSGRSLVYEGNSTYVIVGGTSYAGESFGDIWILKVFIKETAITPTNTSPNIGFFITFEILFIAAVIQQIKSTKRKVKK